jgi:Uma2 family endonuclease
MDLAGLAPVWDVTVDTYHATIDKGILCSGDPVELLEGVMVQKMRKSPSHSFATHAARQALQSLIPGGWFVEHHGPITLSNSEPEPDVLVIRGNSRDYLTRRPGPADTCLVLEIADATLTRDRFLKYRIYAAAPIPI